MIKCNTKELFSVAGVYSITNKVNNKIYIGQSENVYKRRLEHIRELKGERHANWHLQRAFNKYGIENFEFTILEKCSLEELIEKEILYIKENDSLNKHKGYNLKMYDERVTYSKATLEKMSRSQTRLRADKEVRAQMAWAKTGLELSDVQEIKTMLFNDYSLQEISKCKSISINQVRHIKDLNSFYFVLPKYNYYLKNREDIYKKRRIRNTIRLYREGKTLEDIGIALDRNSATPRRIIKEYATIHDQRCRRSSIKYAFQKRNSLIKTLYEMGNSALSVSRKLSVAKGVVRKVVNQEEYSPNYNVIVSIPRIRGEMI